MGSTETVSLIDRGNDAAAVGVAQLFVVVAAGTPRGAARHIVEEIDLVTIGRGDRETLRRSAGGLRRLELRIPDKALSSEHAKWHS